MPSSVKPPRGRDVQLNGPISVVDTACPLDCPDACSLAVSVQNGKVLTIDGSTRNPITDGFICAKVRKFDQRVYGPDRILSPGIRKGRKGDGRFETVTWDVAMARIVEKMEEAKATWGAASILPYSYGGSNGLLTQNTLDATLWRRYGTSRLARTVCAAPTGAANMGLYGKMPAVVYEDYPDAKLIILWGVNPNASGIHLIPYVREAQRRGATLVVIDPRSTQLGRAADVHLAVKPGTDVVVALALHRYLFANGLADTAFLDEHATHVDALRERAAPWTFARAAEVAGVDAAQLEQVARLYAESSPALVRCGWGLERNRNGGSAAAAILALPAVGGKFGVRGGGYSMSNSGSWGITPSWIGASEPDTRLVNMNHLGRALLEYTDPPVQMLFVYNCNPAATVPDQRRIIEGLQRDDLFTVVFEQVMTDTAMYADVVLPATTFLENYDFAKSYSNISLELVRPVIEPYGEARPNADVFGELCTRLGLLHDGEPAGELDMMLKVIEGLPPQVTDAIREDRVPAPPFGTRPIQFVDVFPNTPDGKIDLCPVDLDVSAPAGLYAYQPDPGTEQYPLALISPSSEKTISSTMGELPGTDAKLLMHPDDAAVRGLEDNDGVRVFNGLGEVHCTLSVLPTIRPGTVSLAKGLWRRTMRNSQTGTALVPDTLSDIGGGACFNDARVQVASLPSA